MQKSFSAIALIIAISFAASPGTFAAEGKGHQLQKYSKIERHNIVKNSLVTKSFDKKNSERKSFTVDRSRMTSNGEVKVHIEQTVNENGFNRTITATNAEGQIATKSLVVINDAENGIHSRTMNGTTMEGKTFSGETKRTKTDTGYSSESSMTRPDGKTVSRSKDVIIDKENNLMTVDSSVTLPNGETKTNHVVRDLVVKNELKE